MPPFYDRVGLLEDFVGEGLVGALDVKTGADGHLYYTTFDAVLRLVPPSPSETAELRGMVTRENAEGGKEAVVGATVVLKQRSDGVTVFKHKTLTDETGQYRFTGLPEGAYKAVAKKKGFQKTKVLIALATAESQTLNIVLTPPPL